MGRLIPGHGGVGDGPERGNTRIERLLREEAIMGARAVLGSCHCSEAWLCRYDWRKRIYFDVRNKSIGFREAGTMACIVI